MSTIAKVQARRQAGWEERMRTVILRREKLPFDITTNDCVRFTADIFQAITGVDAAEKFRNYSNQREAREILIALGSGGFRQLVNNVLTDLGCECRPWHLLEIGDVAWFDLDHHKSVAVCNGSFAVTPGDKELMRVPMDLAICGWHIPN